MTLKTREKSQQKQYWWGRQRKSGLLNYIIGCSESTQELFICMDHQYVCCNESGVSFKNKIQKLIDFGHQAEMFWLL